MLVLDDAALAGTVTLVVSVVPYTVVPCITLNTLYKIAWCVGVAGYATMAAVKHFALRAFAATDDVRVARVVVTVDL